jgi:CubicO group peptidase (beta-lactamase class C family)
MILLNRRHLLMQATAMIGAASWPQVAATGPLQPEKTTDIDAALQACVEAKDAPGVVAMAATERSVVYQGSFGLRDVKGEARMSPDTIFRIASMVKLLTSVAAMQLVEQGKLKLDDPAAKIDPTLASPQVLAGFDPQGVPQLRPAAKPITLRNLLSHTSGLSYQLWDANVVRYLKSAKALPRMPLMFDPDSKWAYGSSIDRVGRLVEIASGKRLDRYFHDQIVRPLGMVDTAFVLTESQHGREASLCARKADGTLSPVPLEKKAPPMTFSGGSGIFSTAPDYLRLLQALLGRGSFNGSSILRPETVALMGKNQIGDIEAGVMKTTNPRLSSDVDFFPGVRLRWGLGHMINLDPVENGRKAGSLTWAGLYNTHYWMDPASGIAGVIMMQVLPFADQRALNVYRQFEHGIYRSFKPD